MSDAEAKLEDGTIADLRVVRAVQPPVRKTQKARIRLIPLLITFVSTALALLLGRASWNEYMGAPWTRDGRVRTYVVTMAPEIAGRIVSLPVADNQFVHKGDLLLVIDPTNYRIALQLAQAAVAKDQATPRMHSERQSAGAS